MKAISSIVRVLVVISVMAAAPVSEAAESSSAQPTLKESRRAALKNVDVQEFEKLRRETNTVVLDVRTQKEYAAGHVPGAVNIDVNARDFDKKVAALDKNKSYLVHCAAGVRSAKACGKLSEMGFPKLYNLPGGFRAWEKAGNKPER